MAFLYLTPKLYSTTYPPVDTNFQHTVTDSSSLANNTQMLCSITQGETTFVDRKYYGFRVGATNNNRVEISVLVNGTETGTILDGSHLYTISAETVIYGYSVTPSSVNLWTDPTYIDRSADTMYGRRGLYLRPYSDMDIYDFDTTAIVSGQTVDAHIAMIHGYNNTALIMRKTDGPSPSVLLAANFAGNYSTSNFTPKFKINSTVISTGTVEQEINRLSETVNLLSDQIQAINDQIQSLVPDLTKLVSAEASRNYVAR